MRHVLLEPADASRSTAFDEASLRFATSPPNPGELAEQLQQLVHLAGKSTGPASALVIEAEPIDDQLEQAVGDAGFKAVRTTLQLRRSLPLGPDDRAAAAPIVTRPFEPGRDEDAWVAVNNRAFAWHPDQAGRTRHDIEAEQTEPWFRADGFLIHERDGTMDGFCWTKIHRDHDPPLGEIYVIGVDPSEHGHGLGRSLVVAGLDWLAAVGLTRAMLYVEADNEPALRLYRSLGFAEHQAHRWWRRPLAPLDPPGPPGP